MIEPLFYGFKESFKMVIPLTHGKMNDNVEADNCLPVVDTLKDNISDTDNVNDVTILPENILSFSHCLRFTSKRTERLKSVRETAQWRAIKLCASWICIILFVLWLASVILFSTFPTNPLKSLLKERRKKATKKSKKLPNKREEEEEEPPSPPSICYEELYEFSKWNKFTQGRPITHVFYQGQTYTYDKLPPFPKNKANRAKAKKNLGKKIVTSTAHDNIESEISSGPSISTISCDILFTSNLNPLANSFSSSSNDKDLCATLRSLRASNAGNIIIAHLNINSLRYKFNSLVELIQGNLDILVIGETKLDNTFPDAQFKIDGFKLYRKDRNEDGGGVVIYVRADIPSQEKDYQLPSNVEGVLVEINLRKMKFLLIGVYHSTHVTYGTSDDVFLHELGTCLDVHSSYDKFLIAGDFNMQEHNTKLSNFLDEFHSKNLVKEPTCFKNPNNPSSVDLFITNFPRSFMKTTTITTGLSDFHEMIITVMRTTFPKSEPHIVHYRDQSKFSAANFCRDLENELKKHPFQYDKFEHAFLGTLELHAPQKTKVLRANHKPYVTKEMRKAIMHRSKLQNRLHRNYTPENLAAYKKQKNYCNRLYKRTRKEYLDNLNVRNITDNKKFWRTVKPFFSDKGGTRDKIVLVEEENIINNDAEIAQTFNDFFDGAVKALGISDNEVLLTKVEHPQGKVLDAIKEFESHPSILKIKENVTFDVEFFLNQFP